MNAPVQTKGSGTVAVAGQQVSVRASAQCAPQQNASCAHTALVVAPLQHCSHTYTVGWESRKRTIDGSREPATIAGCSTCD